MQPLKIILPGRFWDSQIYSGRLMLFDLEGSLRVINWDKLIADLDIPDDLRLAINWLSS